MNSLPVIPLSTWAKGKSDAEVSNFLKGFSCKKNRAVQWFLRKLSMRFARLNISATHLATAFAAVCDRWISLRVFAPHGEMRLR